MGGTKTFELAGRHFPRITWYKTPGMRSTYICLMFVVLTSATNGYDGSLINGFQNLPHWQDYFDHPTGSTLSIVSSMMSIGSVIALPAMPYTADILGRRMGIALGCLIMILGVILQSMSINLEMFISARFFIGFGVAIAQGSSPLLITEVVHPQHRAIFTTMYNTTWYCGSIIAAWLTFGTNYIDNDWSWRIPSIGQAVPPLAQLIFVWFVPESPRFEVSKGRVDSALKILADVHAEGDLNDEMVNLELSEIRDTIQLEQHYEKTGWTELWSTKGNRHRLVILVTAGLFSQWSGNGIVSYYIHIILNELGYSGSVEQNLINGCLQILNFIVAFTMCFFVDKIGRRKLFLISTSGMLVAFIAWTICSAQHDDTRSKAAGRAVISMIYVYYLFYNMAWSGLLLSYTCELLFYSIRAKGMTIVFLCIDVAVFFNMFINPIALEDIGWKYYIFYCAWLAVELVVIWYFYVETKNTPLEEIAKHFDGDSAVVGGYGGTEKARRMAGAIQLDSGDQELQDYSSVRKRFGS